MDLFYIVAATAIVAPFILGPILVYSTLRLSAQPEHSPADPDNPFVPPQFAAHIDHTQRALYAEGFNLVGSACTASAWPEERFVAVFENPRAATVALAMVRVRGQKHPRVMGASVHFLTDMANDVRLRTDNDTSIGGCPGADRARLQLPAMRDPRQLLQTHRARVAATGTPAPRAGRVDADASAYANAAYVRDLYLQLARRYLVMDEETMELRPTLRGALATGLRHLGLAGVVRRAVHQWWAVAYLAADYAHPNAAPAVPAPEELAAPAT